MTEQECRVEYVSPKEFIPALPEGNVCYLDLETYAGAYGDALTVTACNVRMISLTTDAVCVDGRATVVYVLDMLDVGREKWFHILNALESYDTICGHNLAFDLPILIRHGMKYPRKIQDTIVASRVLRNGMDTFSHALGNLVNTYLGITLPKDLQTDDWSKRGLSPAHLDYCRDDVRYLKALHDAIHERLEVHDLVSIYELECAVLPAIAAMTLNGVEIDREEWTRRSKAAEATLAELQPQMLRQFPLPPEESPKVVRVKKDGEPYKKDLEVNEKIAERNKTRSWNLASPVQVLQMFKAVNVDLPNTQYETLVARQDDHPALKTFLAWRDVEKEATTFGVEWLNHVCPDGRVHPQWKQLRASTGRMACADPNLQQVPRGAARKGIVAGEGKVFVRADFSQIEARIAAKVSGDPVLIELFQRGDDIHAYAAKAVLGKLTVTPDERQIGKSLVFGLLFSMSAPSLRVYCKTNYGVSLSAEEAEVFRDRFFRTFYGLARWHDRIRRDCNYADSFRSLAKRRRIVAHLRDETNANMLGLGLNTPVQGTAADMLKMAVRELWERREEFPMAKLVMLVHDEIVYEVPEDDAKEVADWLKAVMIDAGNTILDPIPCDASVKVSPTWGG